VGASTGRPKSSRRTLIVWLGGLLAVTVAFAWLAVLSFKLLHENLVVGSNLKPVEVVGPQQIVFSWRNRRASRVTSRTRPRVPSVTGGERST
jgi:hypothetical protein